MSEGSAGSGNRWAAGGMAALPGFNTRPEHHIVNKKNITENVNSTGKSLFVHARNCEQTNVNIDGKIGKLTIENCDTMEITISDNIVSGILEVIKSQNLDIHLSENAEVPVIQVDDSSKVNVYIQRKSQIEIILFIRSAEVKLFLENQTVEGMEGGQTLQYEVSTDEIVDVQRIGHWTAASADAGFITKVMIRNGKYPTISEMKKVLGEISDNPAS